MRRSALAAPDRHGLQVEVVESPESIEGEWSDLAERSGNVFATPEWLLLWWDHFGRGRLRLTACRADDGRLVAIFPLHLSWQRLFRIARFLGYGPGDELGPICAPGDERLAAGALLEALGRWRVDLLIAECLQGTSWRELLGGRLLEREASPVLVINGRTWDDFLAARSRNFRRQLRRAERRAAGNRPLRYRLAEDPESDLDTLFSLHELRWSAGGSDFAGAHRAFQREFALRAFGRGWVRLWFLEIDGRPVAARYLFRFGGADAEYQAGRDPAYPGAGTTLLAHTVEQAFRDGAREYRFLRGGERYKYAFADADPGIESIGVATGPAGRAAVRALAVKRNRRRAPDARETDAVLEHA